MPAVAAVRLDIQDNTSSTAKRLDALKGQLEALGARAGATFSRINFLQAFKGANAAIGVADQFIQKFAPETANEPTLKALREASRTGSQLAAAFAPFMPPFGSIVGGSIGAVAGALGSLSESSREAAKKLRDSEQSIRDSATATALRERRARTPEERARVQADARQRMDDYRFMLEEGASFNRDQLLDAARWDRDLAEEIAAVIRRQNGGKDTQETLAFGSLSHLAYYRSESNKANDALSAARAEADRRYGTEEELAGEERIYSDVLAGSPAWANPDAQRRIDAARAARAARAEMLKPFERNAADAAGLLASAEKGAAAFGKTSVALWGGSSKTAFDTSLDALWEQMQAEKNAPKGGTTPSLRTSLAPAGSTGADSLSSVGIGFTGSDPRSREQVDLLRSISDTLNAIRGHGIPAVAV